MRKVILVEGVSHPSGTIKLGALEVDDREFGRIPIVWQDDTCIGWAKDFERNEETGELSFDVFISAEHFPHDPDEFVLNAFITPFTTLAGASGEPRDRVIDSGTIKMLTAMPYYEAWGLAEKQ